MCIPFLQQEKEAIIAEYKQQEVYWESNNEEEITEAQESEKEALEASEIWQNDAEKVYEPSNNEEEIAENQEYEKFKSLFVSEEALAHFEKEALEASEIWQNDAEKVIEIRLSLFQKYIAQKLIRAEKGSGLEWALGLGSEAFNRELKEFLFAHKQTFSNQRVANFFEESFMSEYEELVLQKVSEWEFFKKFHTCFAKYKALDLPNYALPYKMRLITEENLPDIKLEYGYYTLDLKANLEDECLAFFAHYEAYKGLRDGKIQGKSSEEILSELNEQVENLKKPSPPLVRVSDLLNRKEEKEVPTLESVLEWANCPQVQFTKFAYGIYHANLIAMKEMEEKQLVTYFVPAFANLFAFKLGNQWQSVFSRDKSETLEITEKVIKICKSKKQKRFNKLQKLLVKIEDISASNLEWKGNEFMLISFIQGLHNAKYIYLKQDEKNFTSLVIFCAKLLNFELSENWLKTYQSNDISKRIEVFKKYRIVTKVSTIKRYQ